MRLIYWQDKISLSHGWEVNEGMELFCSLDTIMGGTIEKNFEKKKAANTSKAGKCRIRIKNL